MLDELAIPYEKTCSLFVMSAKGSPPVSRVRLQVNACCVNYAIIAISH